MYCKHCGKPLQPGEIKCSGCGEPALLYKDGTDFYDFLNPELCDLPIEQPDQKIISEEYDCSETDSVKNKKPIVFMLIASNLILILLCLGLILALSFSTMHKEDMIPSTIVMTEESTGTVAEESVASEQEEETVVYPESKNETQPPLVFEPAIPSEPGAMQEITVPAESQIPTKDMLEEESKN